MESLVIRVLAAESVACKRSLKLGIDVHGSVALGRRPRSSSRQSRDPAGPPERERAESAERGTRTGVEDHGRPSPAPIGLEASTVPIDGASTPWNHELELGVSAVARLPRAADSGAKEFGL